MAMNNSLHIGQADTRLLKLIGPVQPLEHAKDFVERIFVQAFRALVPQQGGTVQSSWQ